MKDDAANLKAQSKQKPQKRKQEGDELPLPKKVGKKIRASSAADGDHGDYDQLDDDPDAARPQQSSREKWLEDSIMYSEDSSEEVAKEDSVAEVGEGEQGERGMDKVKEDTKNHFNDQRIGKPPISNQTWESNETFDTLFDIYTLDEAVQLQEDLENLESELFVIRDRTPWGESRRKLCKACKAILDDHLQAEDRRRKSLHTNKLNPVKTRPSLGLLGGFDYFLGLPTLEELAKKQRDIETLRIMRPIRQKFDWEKLEPKLCKGCEKYRERPKIRAPAPPFLKPAIRPQPSTAAPKPPPKEMTRTTISSDPQDPPVQVPADQSRKKPKAQKPAPASVPEPSKLPVPMDPSKIQPKAPNPPASFPGPSQPPVAADQSREKSNVQKPAPESLPEPSQPPMVADQARKKPSVQKTAPESVPEPSQPPMAADQARKKPNVQKPAPESVPEPGQPPVPIDPPQRAPPKDAPPKKVASNKAPTPESTNPDELQPPTQNDRPKRKGPAPKPVAPEEPRSPLQNDGPKRKGPAPKPVASEEPRPPAQNDRPKRKGPSVKSVAPEKLQPPVPGGKPKKKDPTPGPSAPKKDEPIQPAATEKPRKKVGPTSKKNIPDPSPASPKPATQDINKVEDQIEEPGPIQQVMGNLPGKPKGHDYYCAICYTNMTRMNSAKKLEHVEKCGTTLGEVEVMTKAQAQAAKDGK